MLGAEAFQPIANRSLFLDMNSFFASVEQQVDPSLRGRPVGVCPFLHDSTCVLAASVEAKRLGIGTGTPIWRAKQLAPDIVLRTVNAPLYREYHRRIMSMLDDTRARVIVKSIDEALLVLPRDLQPEAVALAEAIKQQLHDIGDWLTCSIGIGPNLFISKMASNAVKPNGLVRIAPDEIESFYATLELTDLYGVSWRLAKRFHNLGIDDPLALYRTPLPLLRQHMGPTLGLQWYLRLRGIEADLRPTNRSSVGHQSTLTPEPAYTVDEVWDVASQLVSRISHRLRINGLTSRSLVVFVRYTNRRHWHTLRHGRSWHNDVVNLQRTARELFEQLPFPEPVRLVGVSAINLRPADSVPASLFPEDAIPERLNQAIDLISERFGRQAIATARHLATNPVADSIGFGNAPDVAQMRY